jgi:hypothetical protein
MRKLLAIVLLATVLSCESTPEKRTFEVLVHVSPQCGFEYGFPLMPASAENPVYFSNMDYTSTSRTTVTTASPFNMYAIARKKGASIVVQIRENGDLIHSEQVNSTNKFPELTYLLEW